MSGPLPAYQPQFTPDEIVQARDIILRQHTAPYMKVLQANGTLETRCLTSLKLLRMTTSPKISEIVQ